MKQVDQQSVEVAPIWTIPETARYLRVSINVVEQLIRNGKIPYQKLGARYVTSAIAVKKYIADGWLYKTHSERSEGTDDTPAL